MNAIEALTSSVASAESDALDRLDQLPAVRRRVLTAAARANPWSERIRLGAYAMAGAALATAVMLGWQSREPAPGYRYEDGHAIETRTGVNLHPVHAAGASLRFSDGSRIVLQRHAQARVMSMDRLGARVVIDQGEAAVDVRHHHGTQWLVEAGPFRVQVTGTSFTVTWDAVQHRFKLTMREGNVIVSGCSVAGVSLGAGQSIEVTCSSDTADFEMQAAASSQPSNAAPTASAPAEVLQPPRGEEPDAALQAEAGTVESPDATADGGGWRALASAGQFREAFTAAEAEGVERICATGSTADLLVLSDAAQFAGNAARARQVLLAIRARFPGSGPSATAAFRLGRLAFDRGQAYGEAGQWFRTYLQEQPGGGLAREASGRLIEVEQRAGSAAAARQLAQGYLLKWPDGPHAALARSLVGD